CRARQRELRRFGMDFVHVVEVVEDAGQNLVDRGGGRVLGNEEDVGDAYTGYVGRCAGVDRFRHRVGAIDARVLGVQLGDDVAGGDEHHLDVRRGDEIGDR